MEPIATGSIAKTFDGFLLADEAARGEVALDDPVGKHLPELTGTPLGEVTLIELASHRGGVPSVTPTMALGTIPSLLTGANPYGDASRASILQEIRDLEPMDTRGSVQYSNLGATLLGWALAEAANQPDWETYVRERLLNPLGITATFAASPEELPRGAVPGFTTNGFEPESWTGRGFQPAGLGAYMTPAAMATYAQSILRENVPGATAMDPRFDAGGPTEIGLAWYTLSIPEGRSLTLHSGRTDTSSTFLVIDRDTDRAVFVAGSTDQPVEDIGVTLLTGDPAPPSVFNPMALILPGIAAVVVAMSLWSAFRARNRISVLSAFAAAVAMLALVRPLGSWAEVPAVVWAGLTLVTAAGAIVAAVRWPRVPWQADWFRVPRVAYAALNILVAGAAVALTATWH